MWEGRGEEREEVKVRDGTGVEGRGGEVTAQPKLKGPSPLMKKWRG